MSALRTPTTATGGAAKACRFCILLAITWTVALSADDEATASQEVFVRLPTLGYVALSTRGPSAFRARLLLGRRRAEELKDAPPRETPMVEPDEADAPFGEISWRSWGEDTACRLNHVDNSTDGDGTVQRKTAKSLAECESICEQATDCAGVEWAAEHLRCGVWNRPIGVAKPKKGSTCLNFSSATTSSDSAAAAAPHGISSPGLGSLTVSAEGRLVLRGPRGELLTRSEPLDRADQPPTVLLHARHPGGSFQGLPGASGDEHIWSGDMVFLRAHTGAVLDVVGEVVQAPDRTRPEWQALMIEKRSGSGEIRHGDVVYLYTHTGNALDVHRGRVRASWDSQEQWQEFVIERKFGAGIVQTDDLVFLKAHTGNYVDVEGSQVAARWEMAGKWQTFNIERAGPGQFLRSGDGLYLEDYQGKLLQPAVQIGSTVWAKHSATKTAAARWVVQKKGAQARSRIFSGDVVYLVNHRAMMLDVEMGTAKVRWNQPGEWEELVVERKFGSGPVLEGDEIFLRSKAGGLYLDVQDNKVLSAPATQESSQTLQVHSRVKTCIQTIALNGTPSASSEQGWHSAWKAADGNVNTAWLSESSDVEWFSIDLGQVYGVSRVDIQWSREYASSYYIRASEDGKTWSPLSFALGHEGWVVTNLPESSRARYIRMVGNERSTAAGYGIVEFVVHVCQLTISFESRGGRLFGRGAAAHDAQRFTAQAVQPQVWNGAAFVPYYYSTDGYAALGAVSKPPGVYSRQVYPVSYVEHQSQLSWGHLGDLELYLMPAQTLDEGTKAYLTLTGAPRVPPRYAFGFTASRWGWESKEDIDRTLEKFRKDMYPLDSIGVGDEWFTNESDYKFSSNGEDWYQDFGFHNRTLPEPQEQLRRYAQKLHVRTGGVRRPRLGNREFLNMARAKEWLLPGGVPGGQYPPDLARSFAYGRNLDFGNEEVRNWYSRQLLHLLDDGLNFWWNDEGETDYFTYHWLNVAQADALRATHKEGSAHKRFYSLNRGFSPGMARLGGTVWTGDITPSWQDLQRTPGVMLNWGLAGAPYVACDIGGFSGETEPELLTRWMQVGVFMPTMRVQSWLWAHPHWPWLYGGMAAIANRKALELRYKLIPYHYSLAHAMFAKKSLWMRPLFMAFPEDPIAAAISNEWMDGQILAAPVMREDSRRQVYLPNGTWYRLNTSHTIKGPVHLGGRADPDEIPAFVRPGTVLTLAPIVQSTDMLPGGPLEVQVYRGADGSCELVEDDGESVNYEVGRLRTTFLQWYDAAGTLSWRARGATSDPGVHGFKQLQVTLFDAKTRQIHHLPPQPLRDGGSISYGDVTS